jgi:hypothetical protein
LAPNSFGDWGKGDVPANAILTVEVTRLDGADDKAAFDADAFTKDDAERLAALEKDFGK